MFRLPSDTRQVLLLRRQPDSTDEIYIEGPLRQLTDENQVALRVVNFGKGWSRRALSGADTLIVSRYILPEILHFLQEHRSRYRKIIYLLDDDLRAVKASEGLPASYRQWIAPFVEGPFEGMLALADHLVVTSPYLQERYASPKTLLLEPALYLGDAGSAALSHYDRLCTIEIVCALASTHHYDLLAIAPALEAVVDRYPHVRLTFIGCEPPRTLLAKRNVKLIPQMPWPRYKRFASRQRAHLSLAPLLETPWNLGKSMIKLIDAVQFGAVPVLSDVAPYRRLVTDGVDSLLVANDPEVWHWRLSEIVEHPERLRPLATGAQRRVLELAAPARARAFWEALLA